MAGKAYICKKGRALLSDPLLNKDTAFTQEERDELGLHGFLPCAVSTPEVQIERLYLNFSKKRTPLGKYSFLIQLLQRNELLFYQFTHKYAAQLLPFIYTPTVGEASVQFSQIYIRQRGLYISYPLQDKIEEIVDRIELEDVDVIVVTDGERILGLGDQGVGGITIPLGKLSLYTLFAGIHPARTLPVILDVGTNNKEHLDNNLYLGWRHPRVQGKDYDSLIARFVKAIGVRFPKVLLQWEDFGKNNARRLLNQYRNQILSFNDDIQGTAAVVMAALIAAGKIGNRELSEMKIAILGGGSAGTGIADMLVQGMVDQGLSVEEARSRIYIVDINGLIHFNSPNLDESQRLYAHPQSQIKDWKALNFLNITLGEVIANAKLSVLIGVCAQPGAFTKEMIAEMASYEDRPIILPLSNPTSRAEAVPQELIEWTDGRAIIATGSPFQPVVYKGETHVIGQCNNVFIFPGLGLGSLAAEASQVTDGMILTAAQTLAEHSPALRDPSHSLFPAIEQVRSVSQKIAVAVAHRAIQDGVSKIKPDEIEGRVQERVWEPKYPIYKFKP